MSEHFSDRTIAMLGEHGFELLKNAKVAVFGIGGVGGYAVEALVRAGVGNLTLVDSDRVSISNINRQIIATHETVGKYKTEAARDRALSINPDCQIVCKNIFYSAESATDFNFADYDYIIDAIDSVSSKVSLILEAHKSGTKIISAMGAGNKLDPTKFRVADISKTAVCPLAKAVRVALRKKGVNHLKVVYSEEEPVTPAANKDSLAGDTQTATEVAPTDCVDKSDKHTAYQNRKIPASVSFVPSVMGLIIAGEVIKDISGVR